MLIAVAQTLLDRPFAQQGDAVHVCLGSGQQLGFHGIVEIMRFRGYQALTRFLKGQAPGPESSIGKLFWSEYHKRITEAALHLAGPAGMVGFGEETRSGIATPAIGTDNSVANWMHTFFVARPGTIYAGSRWSTALNR